MHRLHCGQAGSGMADTGPHSGLSDVGI